MATAARNRWDPAPAREIDNDAKIFLSSHRLSAADLADKLEVSVVTAKRIVARLKSRGERIASVRLEGRTFYEIRDDRPWSEIEKDPFVSGVIKGPLHAPRGKAEDADYDAG